MSKEPTRTDLEFLADCLGISASPPAPRAWSPEMYSDEDLRARVERRASDPIANARAQGRIAALLRELPGDVPEGTKPTRDDLRFMAECLGLRPDVDYRAHEYLLSDMPSLADAVNGRMLDPIANGRARMRIASYIVAMPSTSTGSLVLAPDALVKPQIGAHRPAVLVPSEANKSAFLN